MNNELQTFSFDSITVSIIDHNGEGWLTSEDIGKALEYNEPRISIQNLFDRNREVLEEYSTVIKMMTVDGKERDVRAFNEEGVIIIGFLSKQPKAIAFQKSAAKILKAYRNKELVHQDTVHLEQLLAEKDKLLAAVTSHSDLQTQFINSQNANHETFKEKANAYIAKLSEQNTKLNGIISRHSERYKEWQKQLDRAVRAQRPIEATEKQEIIDLFTQGWALRSLEVWFYRSPSIIRRTLREAGVIA